MPLQKQFTGLSSYLGDYDLGQHSFVLPPTMQAAFLADDFIEAPRWAEGNVTTLGAGVGATTQFITIPDQEVWRLKFMSIYVNSVLTGALKVMFTALLPQGTRRIVLRESSIGNGQNLADQQGFSQYFPNLWLEAGTIIEITTAEDNLVAAVPVQWAVQYQKLTI